MWCAVAHARYVTPGRSADRCVPCTQIILEEAAYCDPGLVSEVVVPLLSMQQSVLLCIR